MMRKFFAIVIGVISYLFLFFITIALVIFISDLLKINPSKMVLISFILPFLVIYYLFYKFYSRKYALRLSFIVMIISVIILIGSCSIFIANLSNAPNYW